MISILILALVLGTLALPFMRSIMSIALSWMSWGYSTRSISHSRNR